MTSTLYFIVLSFFGSVQAYALSKNMLDFTVYFNGDVDTRPQFEAGMGHLLIEARVIPMIIPAVAPYPAMYIEEAINGQVQILQIGVLKDGPNGTVNMQLYNFTQFNDLKPFTFDYKSVTRVRREDLSTDDDCVARMTVVPHLTFGTFPDCRVTVDGKHPRIFNNYTCNSITAVFPPNPGETTTLEPYSFRFLSEKYPQVHAPKGYVSPCENDNVYNTTGAIRRY